MDMKYIDKMISQVKKYDSLYKYFDESIGTIVISEKIYVNSSQIRIDIVRLLKNPIIEDSNGVEWNWVLEWSGYNSSYVMRLVESYC